MCECVVVFPQGYAADQTGLRYWKTLPGVFSMCVGPLVLVKVTVELPYTYVELNVLVCHIC